MAKYNREFLVPYLRDVCALHLVQRKILNRIQNLQNTIHTLEQGKPVNKPQYPYMENKVTVGRVISLLIGGFFAFMVIFGIIGAMSGELSGSLFIVPELIYVVLAAVFILSPLSLMHETDEANGRKYSEYKQQLKSADAVKAANEEGRKKIPDLRAQVDRCTQELQRVRAIGQKVYASNIIPGQYRNIYAAVYLYDYFSNSREDDLALALNTFVLEQIKAKLDVIIANQSEMILNQAMMLANQQRSLELQNQHTAQMQAMAHRIASSAEEQSAYLSMIESNTATTAYFATADFIRRL